MKKESLIITILWFLLLSKIQTIPFLIEVSVVNSHVWENYLFANEISKRRESKEFLTPIFSKFLKTRK